MPHCPDGPFHLIVRMGARVVEASAPLPRPVMYLRKYNLVIVSPDLDDEGREEAADWLLAEIPRQRQAS